MVRCISRTLSGRQHRLEIVHRHGRDARHVDSVESDLEFLEPRPVEALSVRDVTVAVVPSGLEHRVREVVVFIEHQVEMVALRSGALGNHREPAGDGRLLCEVVAKPGAVLAPVAFHELVKALADVFFKAFLKGHADVSADFREVHVEDLIAVFVLRRRLRDFKAAEEGVEVVFFGNVIVAAEHFRHKRLSEAARPDEKEEGPGPFKKRDVAGFVNVVVAFLADALEVGNAVWDFEVAIHA